MLTELGMKNAPVVEERAKGSKEFYLTVSAEKASTLEADVFLTYITEDSEVGGHDEGPARRPGAGDQGRAPSSRRRTRRSA